MHHLKSLASFPGARTAMRLLWRLRGVEITEPRTWDSQYQTGHWSSLKLEQEKFSIISAMIERHSPAGSVILDIGCGEGWLSDHLRVRSYRGVDLSQTAIDRAKSELRPSHHSFEARDAWEFVERAERSDERYGAIVLNEVLYYIPHYLELIARADRLLHENGVIIISVFTRKNLKVWNAIHRAYGSRLIDSRVMYDQWRLGAFARS